MTFTSVYEDDFLRAFPMVLDEMEEVRYFSSEESFRHCYCSRVCQRFLVFLGLAEMEAIKGDKDYIKKYKIKRTPLFDAVVHVNFLDPNVHKGNLHWPTCSKSEWWDKFNFYLYTPSGGLIVHCGAFIL